MLCGVTPDPDSGRLEQSAVQWHGLHFPVGSAVFHRPHDFWQLRSIQPAGGYSGRGLPDRGKVALRRPEVCSVWLLPPFPHIPSVSPLLTAVFISSSTLPVWLTPFPPLTLTLCSLSHASRLQEAICGLQRVRPPWEIMC